MTYTVLIVDDHELWRRFVNDEVRSSPQWRIVGEAADGNNAVCRAAALKPDLVLLDVGLPKLNGLEAARRILANNPSARILFLTEERSPDVAEAALVSGVRGYLFKTDSGGGQLLRAMTTVVNGGRFLSPALAKHFGTDDPSPADTGSSQEGELDSGGASALDE